jgi:glutamine synthetase
MADNHVIYKNGRQGDRAPERLLDHVHGRSHSSLDRGTRGHIPRVRLFRDGEPAFAEDDALFEGFLAGLISVLRGAPISSPDDQLYKRYAAGSSGPDDLAWGHDNRTCGFRIWGHGPSRRVRDAIPGGDVNP